MTTWSATGPGTVRAAAGAAGTRIGYPGGGTVSSGTVLGTVPMVDGDGRTALGVILDVTAAHPVSPTWPDQPADLGVLRTGAGVAYPLLDVRQGVLTDGALTLDARGAEGAPVVVHLVDGGAALEVGSRVQVVVDAALRRSLSLAHSACHLSALALDAALEPYWTKTVDRTDPLGRPAFDQLAITSSRLHPWGSVDVYRLGKSLRKKGFDAAALAVHLHTASAVHAAHLRRWVDAAAPLRVEAGDGTLAARRSWCCRLDDTEVAIPCGGTHATSTAELVGIAATYELSAALDQLVVTTTLPGG